MMMSTPVYTLDISVAGDANDGAATVLQVSSIATSAANTQLEYNNRDNQRRSCVMMIHSTTPNKHRTQHSSSSSSRLKSMRRNATPALAL